MWFFLSTVFCSLSFTWCWPTTFHQHPLYRSLNFSTNSHVFQLAESRRQQLDTTENKVEKLGQYFKRNVRKLREKSSLLDMVFLVDESSSVGYANFVNELKFVKKLLSDFPVVPSATRVAIVTFSSKNNVQSRVDYISSSQSHQHKCSLLNKEIPAITYKGGGTYTKGAFQQAAQILRHSRGNSTKVIFLITDGYSNGGDPRPVAMALRELGVEIFTFGIWQGNIRELHDMASHPKEEHCYVLHNFAEFEALARRALHEDLPSGSYIQESRAHCSYLCEEGEDCCDVMASCKCGTHTGQFECICEKGYYGKGLQHECTACPSGTYKPEGYPGGISTCLACPDVNHTSPPGSTSVEDCTCKEGFRAVGQSCEVVQCPEMRPPENGYFIQNVCNNQFDAACGIRCHNGFDLVGSSIRLCQPNGVWSGSEATCRVRTCPKLPPVKHGNISCSSSDTSYKTVCLIRCEEGYRLQGNNKLTCQINSQWDEKEPHCEEIYCPSFHIPENVMVNPLGCGEKPAKTGTVCQLNCVRGFTLTGVTKEVTCVSSGKWNQNTRKAACKDTEPPQISCPDNIQTGNLEHQNSAMVSWETPIAKDNSGDEVSVQVSPAFLAPQLFPIGEEIITYTATDRSGNQATCTFKVTVLDIEPPVIDWCRSPAPIQTTEDEHTAKWEEPQFSDNSGAPLIVTKTHSPGDVFPLGETKVQYTATDPSGNNRTCEIHIVIRGSPCETPFTPDNGEFVCTKDKTSTNCTLVCSAGYTVTEGSVENYYCAHEDGVWTPPHPADWTDCSVKRFANHGYKSYEMLYKATKCDDTNLLKNFADAFQSSLGKMVPTFCNDVDDIDCRLEDLSQKQCLEYNYDYENGFAIGPGGWGTLDRVDYTYDDFLDTIQEEQIQKHLESAPKTAPLRVKRHRRISTPNTDQKIKLIFNITASVPLPERRNDTVESENQRRLLKTLETITNRLKRTLKKEPMYSFHFASEVVVADSNSLESEQAFLFCRPGTVLKGRMCVNCPVGTYYSLEHHTCESCWKGTYQDDEGQMECKNCPPGSYTEYLHSRSILECKAQCKPGTFSSSGLETCESCPLGTFQPASGSRNCEACPKRMSTVKRGALDVSECGVLCPAGEFSRSGLMPCYPCPRDYYQPDGGKSYCLACPFYGTTTVIGARSIAECSSFGSSFSAAEESVIIPTVASKRKDKKQYKVSSQVFHDCFQNPCHNGGTCKEVGTGYICLCITGYTGSKCEMNIDECKSLPCLNQGLCKDGVGEFSCQCQPGFGGLHCEIDINECSSQPCLNEATCVDGVASYHCTCAKGFEGTHCEEEVNECLSNPCLNSGVCVDKKGSFQCQCPSGFMGAVCEKNIDDCLSRPCKNGAQCIDGINSFRCQCAPGYAGLRCENDINECEANPCMNQATCMDSVNAYLCKCPPGFTGTRCETEPSSGFNLDFEVSGIYGYVLLDGILPALSAITCTFWMRSSDSINYGTPISYAVEDGSYNTFLLTDYNGWVLYINGKERITDCPPVNDGKWHHIAVTWTSTDGSWNVYIDGKISDGGKGLSEGLEIPGGGALVLAQEQDQRGEGFNPAESFVGSISQVNVWDHVLLSQEVLLLATSCPEKLKRGNVLAWPDFLPGVVGRVKIDSKSIFCAECPALEGAIPYLHTSSSNLKPGSEVSLYCDPGFQIVGNPVQQCLNMGQWTQPLPRCDSKAARSQSSASTVMERTKAFSGRSNPAHEDDLQDQPGLSGISCGVPPDLENGFYSAEDFFAGSTVTYQCNTGYYLLGDSRMFCTDNGSWNGISPSCLDVDECALGSDCDKLHSTCLNTNGSHICSCIPPYTGDGKTCREPVKCKKPGHPEHGHSTGDMNSIGSVISFSCNDGYLLTGPLKVTCMDSGEWSDIPPYCQAISCGDAVVPDNGAVEGSNFTFGNTVIYSCNKGYSLLGPKEASCLANGTWSNPPPSCEVVMCPTPEDVSNGKYTLTGQSYLSTVLYTCINGYSLQGSSKLTCEASGQWSGLNPTCQLVSCGPPPVVREAVISGKDFTFANSVTYTCKEGYTLIGPATLECLSTGKWSENTPQCVAVSCDEPPNVYHASPETSHRLFGDIAFYYCADGYSLADNSQMICNAQGKWVSPEGKDMPRCIADFCERPASVPYSILESLQKTKFAAGSVVSFKCMEGFVLNTSAKIECVRGGQWIPSPFTIQCIPIRCGEPPSLKNGYVSGTNFSFDAVIAYSCNKGFYIKGEKKRTCEAKAEWSGRMPTCQPVFCGDPPPIENGVVEIKAGLVFQDEVTYHCNPGYRLTGSPVRVCQANRQWFSETPPACVLLSCGKPPPLQHGYSKGERFEVGSRVEFFCDDGYELTGDTGWNCLKTGKWFKKQTPVCLPAKCPDPPLLENQLVLKEMENEVGAVQFFCKEGYSLHGPSALKCLQSQQWNDSFPFCEPVLCEKPPYIPFGEPTIISLNFGSKVKYSCMNGFLLKGVSEIECHADGFWSPSLPECIPVECPHPEEIQNGIVDVQGLTFLSTALYTCKPGFELIGNTTILCGENGQWIGGRPACQPVQCPEAKSIQYGIFSHQNLFYGQTITYSCQTGYQLEGQNILTCLETGKWDFEAPICKAISCDAPEAIENGFVEGADYSYGAMIIYSCMPGFQLSGLAMQTCEESGWSSSTPMCVPTDCGLPPHIDFGLYSKIAIEGNDMSLVSAVEGSPHAKSPTPTPTARLISSNNTQRSMQEIGGVELSDFLYGTVILYICFSGYEVVGNAVLICQEEGTWNGSAPVCVAIECKLPSSPENGFILVSENTLGSRVQYGCKPGYELVGSDSALCLSDRHWSSPAPYCAVISCGTPNKLLNGSFQVDSYVYGSVAYYKCDAGFKLDGSEKRICGDNKKWDGQEPICVPVSCGPPPTVEFGQADGNEYTFLNCVHYHCNEGYRLDGNHNTTCLEDGSWSASPPVCRPVKCAFPQSMLNGEVAGSGDGFGDEIHYHCQAGYILHGTQKRTCQADGNWDGQTPHCEPVNCGPPEDISHGFLNGSTFTFEGYIQYLCFPGYELQGNALRQCMSNGFWSGTPPTCLPCNCPPPVVQNGKILGDGFNCGEVVRFQCHEGFKLLGLSEIRCESAGKWSSGFPHCGRVSCGSPPSIPHAFINGSSSLDENAILYSCMTGYVMKGAAELICTMKGTWSEPYPRCEITSCGPALSVPNAVASGDSHIYGNKVEYSCLEGYVMSTEANSRTCQEDGQWSTENIVCSPRRCPPPTNTINVLVPEAHFFVNKTAVLSCTEGYVLSGKVTPVCQADGTWLPPISDALCTPVSCEKPKHPENGILLGTRYLYRDSILYQCNTGYELLGEPERICQVNMTWSGREPECRRISCRVPELLEHGSIQGKSFMLGDELLYSCNPGYEIQGPSRRICHVNKQWTPAAPTCVSVSCGPHPNVDNAFAIATGNVFKSNVTFICHSGRHLVGPPNITCLASGLWSNPIPSCEDTLCEAPAALTNGLVARGNLTAGSRVEFSCYDGYSLEGEAKAECMDNGSWSHPPPWCKPNPCPVPFIIPEYAVVSETEFFVGQNVSINCQKGYQLRGDAVMTCNPEETWTQTSAKCEKITCGPPPRVPNGIVRGSFYNYGDMLTYSCYSGYMLEGSLRSVCLENETWTAAPVCKAVCRFPCQNGGVCERPNACSCLDGWMGRLCEEPICILPCLNGGRCIAPYSCACQAGWTGSRCHAPVCQYPCLNGGKCIRPNRCHCPPAWSGPDCSRKRKPGFYPF
ncbi:sushi, von Willebrand factor type A, EGF and pentraxin domain-containing protein 1 isoform X1 [Pleurodeles waltl]|uniref:sushi, von Willebrand factor type A, EGF and pentraxin domain-containing protein 1 isoform X1 n=1 Tax=Pleurodeles waltl TaxID=8319 RepID=UPI0037096EDC